MIDQILPSTGYMDFGFLNEGLEPLMNPFGPQLEPFSMLPAAPLPAPELHDDPIFNSMAIDPPFEQQVPENIFTEYNAFSLEPDCLGNGFMATEPELDLPEEPVAFSAPPKPDGFMVNRKPGLEEIIGQIEASIEDDADSTPGEDFLDDFIDSEHGGQEVLKENSSTGPCAQEFDTHEKPPVYPHGMSTRDVKPEPKPKITFERKFPIKLWRPRRSSGIRRSSKSDKKASKNSKKRSNESVEYKECLKEGVVTSEECQACEHFDDGQCTWHEDSEENKQGRE